MNNKRNLKNSITKTMAMGFIALTLITGTVAGSTLTYASDLPLTGSAAAFADKEYTLEEMLTYAIQDEYAAKAEYDAIIKTFDTTKPYTNIIKSEETHINLLLPLFDTYGYEVPADTASKNVVIPATLTETYPIGVDAEIKNIAMYEAFLKQDLPTDVANVFTYLQNASENHLSAFEKQVDRNITTNANTNSNTNSNPNSNSKGFSGRGRW